MEPYIDSMTLQLKRPTGSPTFLTQEKNSFLEYRNLYDKCFLPERICIFH